MVQQELVFFACLHNICIQVKEMSPRTYHKGFEFFGQHNTQQKYIPTCEEILRSELFSTTLSNLSPLASMLSMVLCCKYQNQEHSHNFAKEESNS